MQKETKFILQIMDLINVETDLDSRLKIKITHVKIDEIEVNFTYKSRDLKESYSNRMTIWTDEIDEKESLKEFNEIIKTISRIKGD